MSRNRLKTRPQPMTDVLTHSFVSEVAGYFHTCCRDCGAHTVGDDALVRDGRVGEQILPPASIWAWRYGGRSDPITRSLERRLLGPYLLERRRRGWAKIANPV